MSSSRFFNREGDELSDAPKIILHSSKNTTVNKNVLYGGNDESSIVYELDVNTKGVTKMFNNSMENEIYGGDDSSSINSVVSISDNRQNVARMLEDAFKKVDQEVRGGRANEIRSDREKLRRISALYGGTSSYDYNVVESENHKVHGGARAISPLLGLYGKLAKFMMGHKDFKPYVDKKEVSYISLVKAAKGPIDDAVAKAGKDNLAKIEELAMKTITSSIPALIQVAVKAEAEKKSNAEKKKAAKVKFW